MSVIMYPELRPSPNSAGTRFQPEPVLGAKVIGCPDFPSQHQAAWFNVCLRRLLNHDEPAYAPQAEQAINGPAEGSAKREYVEAVVLKFIQERGLTPRAKAPESPKESVAAATTASTVSGDTPARTVSGDTVVSGQGQQTGSKRR